jgi:hypothetical protein
VRTPGRSAGKAEIIQMSATPTSRFILRDYFLLPSSIYCVDQHYEISTGLYVRYDPVFVKSRAAVILVWDS